MYVHFKNLYTCRFNQDGWDSTVILGDTVYTEHKGGPLKLQVDPGQDDKDVKQDLVDDAKRKIVIKSTELTSNYSARVKKAADELMKMLLSPADREMCSTILMDRPVDILPGNHSFDVDLALETSETQKVFRQDIHWDEPFIRNQKENDVSVYFLDINPGYMTCLSDKPEFTYADCLLVPGNDGSTYLPTPEQARAYARLLVAALFELKLKSDAAWRVVRTHNPLLNPENDFNPIVNFKVRAYCMLGDTQMTMP